MKKRIVCILLFICSIIVNAQEKNAFETKLDSIGIKIDETLANLDKEYVNNIYDVNEITKRFLIVSKNKKIKQFNQSFEEGFSSSFDFGQIILTQLDGGASYDYLNFIKDENDDYYLLFRLYGEGLNYHKHLIKVVNGEVKIVDSYIYLTGEFLSDTFKSIYKGVLLKGGLLGNLTKSKGKTSSLADLVKVQQMKNLKSQGKFQEAYELYNTLSEAGKRKKIYKIANLMITAQLDEAKYTAAITDYEKEFPNDISLFLVSIDGYIMNKNYDKALEAVNNLDKAIGGDSFLNFFRANIHYLKEEQKEAEALFIEITNEYPNFLEAYDSLLTVYIETNNTTKAIEVLNVMVNDFELPKDVLFDSLKENFPEFYKKEEVINWSK